MTAKKTKIIAATARIEPPRKPTRQQRIRQHRQAAAWKRKAEHHNNAVAGYQ